MTKELFAAFRDISAKEWKQKIQHDLKGADYNDSLIWKSPDGVDVKPFYAAEDRDPTIAVSVPKSWNIVQQIYVADVHKAAQTAGRALSQGADAIWFIIPSENLDLRTLLEKLPRKKIKIYLKLLFLPKEPLQFEVSDEQEIVVQVDFLGSLAEQGNWFYSCEQDFDLWHKSLRSNSRVVTVDLSLFQNAGASIPQQLAYTLAKTNEYFNYLSTQDPEILRSVTCSFSVSVGPNYFFEIAKLRALRSLFSVLAAEYGANGSCDLLAFPGMRNKTLYDYNTNLLRSTTECMSAVLGGADQVCNWPYDALYKKNNKFSSRLARNQLLILRHEAYLDKGLDPAKGSYYIENLSTSFAQKGLELFKDLEKGGGFVAQLQQGNIQKKIRQHAQAEQAGLDSGEVVLVGTNVYPNKEDRMNQNLELYPFLKKNPRKTLFPPILPTRLAEKLEQQRLKSETDHA